jgi:hypothetical protein
MTKLALVFGTLLLLAAVGAGWLALGAAVRGGELPEQIYRLPPNARYRVIIRIGSDGRIWGGDRWPHKAVNVWVHGRNTAWRTWRLLHIPLGEDPNFVRPIGGNQ